MCLAIPMRIDSVTGGLAKASAAGATLDISVALIEEPATGDYVLVHAGFAIKKIDETEAKKTADLLNKLANY